MKTIKKLLIFAFLFAGTMTFAQQNMGYSPVESDEPNQKPEVFFLEQLNLSAEQKASLKKIQKDYDRKDSISYTEFQNKRELEKLNRMNEFKSLLNKDQQDKFESLLLLHAQRALFNDKVAPDFQAQIKPDKMGMKSGKSSQMHKGKAKHDGKHKNKHDGKGMKSHAKSEKNISEMHDQKMGSVDGKKKEKSDQNSMLGIAPADFAQMQTTHLIKTLYLNGPQATKIQQINLKYALKRSANVDVKKGDRQKEIRSVLDEKQKVEYNAILKME